MIETIKTLFWASRPISWINTAYPFAVAYFLTTGSIDTTLVVGTLFFLIPYNLLMYGINDVFDYESDLRNPRKGGIEGALLALAAGLGLDLQVQPPGGTTTNVYQQPAAVPAAAALPPWVLPALAGPPH